MQEIWKDIPGYENRYQVSSFGRVKSLGNNKTRKEKILKPYIINNSYYSIDFHYKGKRTKNTIHQLVAITFLNHIPCGHNLVVDHINDNSFDNRVENLQLISQRENVFKTQGKYSSQYKGVSWNIGCKKWVSNIWNGKKLINLGYFIDEYEAHLEYQKALDEIKKG